MRARLRVAFTGDDAYEMTLALARPGGEFVDCQSMVMRRQC